MAFMNQFKTIALLAVLTALLLFAGQLLGGTTGLVIGLIFALILNFGSYWFSDKIVLRMYNAREINESQSPDLFRLVREVSQKAKIPMPKVYIIPGTTPNAFATGRSPKHSAVAFTEGILQLLSKTELEGVIAHEMSHIKNRDTLVATIAATIAGVISYLATMAQWAAIFGGFGGRDDDSGGMIQFLVLAILTPIIATIIQLMISRSREYLADQTAAKMLHNSHGLAHALEKLKTGVEQQPLRHGSTTAASLFIINPFSKKGFINLFSTHPPIEERVRKLKEMIV